jgi:protease-4
MVDSIGQGRVWSGTDAINIHLVDALGGIDKAVAIAARMAKVKNYRTVSMPEQQDFLKKLIDDYSDNTFAKYAESKLGESYRYYWQLQSMLSQKGILARMPYQVEIY